MAIKLSKAKIEEAVKRSRSLRDMLLILGLSVGTNNYTSFRKYLAENNIDVSHWAYHHASMSATCIGRGKGKTLQQWMQQGTVISSSKLKAKMQKAGLLINKCAICGLASKWQNKKLVLILDHINGINNDNRQENLRLLCPNCNSQQPTFCRPTNKSKMTLWECKKCKEYFPRKALNKNEFCVECRKADYEKSKECQRKFHVTAEVLKKLIWEMPTSQVAKIFNVSDKAIEKRCKKFGIEKPPRGYWAKKRSEESSSD